MARQDRIDFTSETPLELNNPFANLEVDHLPLGEAPATPVAAPKRGRVVLRRETAHRGGKTVIVVHDFPSNIPLQLIREIGRKLQSACGCGGTVKQRRIEIQGNQVAKIRALLEQEGFRVAGVS